jgi:hypothetical protein
MLVKDLLHLLQLGSSVAESDADLRGYFVETEAFRELICDRIDIVAGDKGSGKSAIYRILSESYTSIPELRDVQVLSAFNPRGTPIFQQLAETDVLSENQYMRIWKSYFLALAGNWILQLADGDYTEQMERLDSLLVDAGLRSRDDTPEGVFAHLFKRLASAMQVKTLEAALKVGPAEIGGKIELLVGIQDREASSVPYDRGLRLLNDILDEMDTSFWFTIDRLDESFQGRPELEKCALRALFRSYLDMQEFGRIRLKLFIRRDLLARITSGGFVNLTHVNARLSEIHWDEDDLRSLLHRRVLHSGGLVERLAVPDLEPESIFKALFPQDVQCANSRTGRGKPPKCTEPWLWMMRKIADGNGSRAPRNLIDLVKMARESQLRRERRAPRAYTATSPVIEAAALQQAIDLLSNRRVSDTLMAEAGDFASVIDKFRGGRPEYEASTLANVLGGNYSEQARYLHQIGFLETTGAARWRVPPLYRSGLDIASA